MGRIVFLKWDVDTAPAVLIPLVLPWLFLKNNPKHLK